MSREDRKLQRERQLQKRMIMSGMAILAVIFAISCFVRMKIDKKNEQTVIDNSQGAVSEEVTSGAPEAEGEVEDAIVLARASAKEAGAPEEILELLDKNPETADFVAHYGELKDVPPAETVGELPDDGSLPHLLQWDARWGYQSYGVSCIAASGCGPTCLSMVITGLTGDASVTPCVLAKYAEEMGYMIPEGGTYANFMWETLEKWGIESVDSLENEAFLRDEIAKGNPVVCNLDPGKHFTDVGHFIVITGYDDGVITVLDPFSIENTEKEWNYSDIKEQITGLYAYSVMK